MDTGDRSRSYLEPNRNTLQKPVGDRGWKNYRSLSVLQGFSAKKLLCLGYNIAKVATLNVQGDLQ